jgi:hypothetical protein
MIPTPTPIILSDPVANSGTIPLAVWALLVVAIGLQVLKFYRRRQMVQQTRGKRPAARKDVKS